MSIQDIDVQWSKSVKLRDDVMPTCGCYESLAIKCMQISALHISISLSSIESVAFPQEVYQSTNTSSLIQIF